MSKPMIENSDRGITLNKSLAWTMLVAICGLVWFGGATITRLQAATETLTATLNRTEQIMSADRAHTISIEARVRVLENTATRQDVKFDMLSRGLDEVKIIPARDERVAAADSALRRLSASQW